GQVIIDLGVHSHEVPVEVLLPVSRFGDESFAAVGEGAEGKGGVVGIGDLAEIGRDAAIYGKVKVVERGGEPQASDQVLIIVVFGAGRTHARENPALEIQVMQHSQLGRRGDFQFGAQIPLSGKKGLVNPRALGGFAAGG